MEVRWIGTAGQGPMCCRCLKIEHKRRAFRNSTILRFQKSLIQNGKQLKFDPLRVERAVRVAVAKRSAREGGGSEPGGEENDVQTAAAPADNFDTSALPENFCIIESRESVKNFANMQLDEIKENIQARRNKIFLLMEEVRRLRIQARLKGGVAGQEGGIDDEVAVQEEAYPSFIPFFPPVSQKTLRLYINFYLMAVASIILFGGLIAPSLEVKLGLGGLSYYEFIESMHLPTQLAEVDPIVASFCGGAVGVLTSLLVVEANNAKIQARSRCIYCQGTGYLTCGNCLGTGVVNMSDAGQLEPSASQAAESSTCSFCSGTGKVMCTACLCTGKQLATEHDPRVDPFTLTGP